MHTPIKVDTRAQAIKFTITIRTAMGEVTFEHPLDVMLNVGDSVSPTWTWRGPDNYRRYDK